MIGAIALVLAAASLTQDPANRPVVITNVTVIPMDRERVVANQSVVVERGVIARLGPANQVRIPDGAQQVDGSGKYLIPGLVDVHVHLASNPEDEQRHILKLFLANGVTSVVNMRGTPQILELRAAVANGQTLGPRLYTVGPYVNEPLVTTPDEVEKAVVEQKRAGYDFVKLHGSLSRDAYARLIAVGRREGIRVIGHAPRNLGVDVMFAERQYAVAHAEEFLYDTNNSSTDASVPGVDARVPEFARGMAQAGIWLMPNLTAFKAIADQVRDLNAMLARPEMKYLPRSNREGWGPATNPYTTRFPASKYPGFITRYRVLEHLVRACRDAGVRLLVGTDAMNTGVVPGFSAHDELADLVAAGLTPFEALQAATKNAADYLATRGDRGVIAVGQKADLVLIAGNPLDAISNTRRISGVMVRGRWLPRSEIGNLLEQLAAAP
jgi:imidazolonepropionase-like amidohydrolase